MKIKAFIKARRNINLEKAANFVSFQRAFNFHRNPTLLHNKNTNITPSLPHHTHVSIVNDNIVC